MSGQKLDDFDFARGSSISCMGYIAADIADTLITDVEPSHSIVTVPLSLLSGLSLRLR